MCPKSASKKSLSLRLTAAQRQSLMDCPVLGHAIQERLQQAGDGTQMVEFTMRQVNRLLHEAEICEEVAHSPRKQRLRQVAEKIVDALNRDALPGRGPGKAPATVDKESVYQFKITLQGIEPPIWRRIQTRNCTLADLHEIIQTAMGWEDAHLHQFNVRSLVFGDPEMLQGGFDDVRTMDSRETWLCEILAGRKKGFRFHYEYDFGDSWKHELLFEGCVPVEKGKRYPSCLDGGRACPLEDIGGVWGYAALLDAVANPRRGRRDERLEWVDHSFDPEAFDAAGVDKRLRAMHQRV